MMTWIVLNPVVFIFYLIFKFNFLSIVPGAIQGWNLFTFLSPN
jgi:hypothetical protein